MKAEEKILKLLWLTVEIFQKFMYLGKEIVVERWEMAGLSKETRLLLLFFAFPDYSL